MMVDVFIVLIVDIVNVCNMLEIKYNNTTFNVSDDYVVSVSGKNMPEWVVTASVNDDNTPVVTGIYNQKTSEVITASGKSESVTNDEDI